VREYAQLTIIWFWTC